MFDIMNEMAAMVEQLESDFAELKENIGVN